MTRAATATAGRAASDGDNDQAGQTNKTCSSKKSSSQSTAPSAVRLELYSKLFELRYICIGILGVFSEKRKVSRNERYHSLISSRE